MFKRVIIWIGVIAGVLAVSAVIVAAVVVSERQEDRQDRAMIAAAVAKQHGNGNKLTVERSSDAGESKVMEIHYSIGVGDCIVELEANEDRPAAFWLDEVHTPRTIGDDQEQDVTAGADQQPTPTKQWVIDHINTHKRYYNCI